MDTLCNPVTGECSISYDASSEDKHLLEDKIVSVLGSVVCLLNKGRDDVLSGRSLIVNTFSDFDVHVIDDKLPPLAFFRGEMKRYCESLHVAFENFLTPDDLRSIDVWRMLQRLKNVTEGLRWLLERGFKTIIDLRAETIKDNLYEKVLDEAIFSGNIEVLKLPVEVGTTPSVQQVEKFAAMVSDVYKRPIYLHSREGVWRTSAMVSRWRQYINSAGELLRQIPEARENKYLNKNVADDTVAFTWKGTRPAADSGVVSYTDENPLKSQLPPSNLFSRNEMSTYFRSRKVSPTTYFTHQKKRLGIPKGNEIIRQFC
ncbi:hypothetical protein K7X08_026596 [Anisodus acutangulus]|uniref:DSP-PTPase phosphatase fused to NAD+ Kinase domain-containing protein n=1 Tax=Anisodus acutangulus TaxID=402998 RepID=A0A9Q1QZB6_9SOLA|nr:hypothetical protein K7X08_026596 [Anisodus acutangulus]